jgi:hypothetical protein
MMVTPLVKDDFFSEEDLTTCINYASRTIGNAIYKDPQFTEWIWNGYRAQFLELNPEWTGLYEDVTVSNSSKPVPLHRDQVRNAATHKILIFLNAVEHGGTILYKGSQEILIQNRRNRLLCFDISLYHKSQIFTEGRKLSIGFRPRLEPNLPKN